VSADAAPLLRLLEGLPEFVPTPDLQTRLAELWPEVSSDEAQRIALAMMSLAHQRLNRAADVLGVDISESTDLDIHDTDRERFGAVLAQLVEMPVLRTSAKAVSVLNQQERLFLDARIMSDIRPVFGDDPSERPTGAVVLHTLSIQHHTDGHTRMFNVAMDRNDLADLKLAVERAIDKAATLSRVMDDAGLALFELEEADDA
jgi:hypothetical protein